MPEILDRRISFNAGEISPWLDPRIDMDKYRMGCRRMKNMRPSIYGGAMRRPGTLYMGEAAGRCRLVPFVVRANVRFILEFSDFLLRIWDDNDGLLLLDAEDAPIEVSTPYPLDDLNTLQFAQQNDVLFITHPDFHPMVLARYADTQWTLNKINITYPATLGPNTTLHTIRSIPYYSSTTEPSAWSSGTTYAAGAMVKISGLYYMSLAGSNLNHTPASSPTWWTQIQWANEPGNDMSSVPTAYSGSVYYLAGAVVSYNSKYYARTEYGSGEFKGLNPSNTLLWVEVAWSTSMQVSEFLSKGKKVILESSTGIFTTGHVGSKWVVGHRREDLKKTIFMSSAAGTVSDPLYVLGEWTATLSTTRTETSDWSVNVIIQRSYDLITWETHNGIQGGTGAIQALLTGHEDEPVFLRLKIYSKTGTMPGGYVAELEAGNPDHNGLVTIQQFISATQVEAVVDFQLFSTDTTMRWEEGAWSAVNGYPRAVTLHENRLWMGGNYKKPTTLWASAVDKYSDFRVGTVADNGQSYTLQADESSTIEWMVSQELLVIGTTSAEWVFGQRVGEDVAKLRRNTVFGSAPIQGRAVNDAIVYVQRSRRKMREYAYSMERDGFASNDLNMLAEHLGDEKFVQIAIQRNPETVVWVVTDSGKLLCMTYERGQSVAGWSTVETQGLVHSVAIVPGDGEDDHIWISTFRDMPAGSGYLVERFAIDQLAKIKATQLEDLVYVDCAEVVTLVEPSVTITIDGVEYVLEFVSKAWGGSDGDLLIYLYRWESGSDFVTLEGKPGRRSSSLGSLQSMDWKISATIGMMSFIDEDAARVERGRWRAFESNWTATDYNVQRVGTGMFGSVHASRTVAVLAGGRSHREIDLDATGQFDADFECDQVVVGLPYESVLEPTYLETPDPGSVTKLGKKRLHRGVIELWQSGAFEISADGGSTYLPVMVEGTLAESGIRYPEWTGIVEQYLEAGTDRQASVILRTSTAVPLHVMALGLRYNVEMS